MGSGLDLSKINDMRLQAEKAEDTLELLKKESAEWVPNADALVIRIADLLHEGCRANHIDACGYFYDKANSSYGHRATKIIAWCETNSINPEFMLSVHPNMLKDMFK